MDGFAKTHSLLVHPASPSHRCQESQYCAKDQWWRAFWPFDWWFSGMEFCHTSCCTRYIQGTKRLLLDWSVGGGGNLFKCSLEIISMHLVISHWNLGAGFSWLGWSISDDLWRHVVYGSSLHEEKQNQQFWYRINIQGSLLSDCLHKLAFSRWLFNLWQKITKKLAQFYRWVLHNTCDIWLNSVCDSKVN